MQQYTSIPFRRGLTPEMSISAPHWHLTLVCDDDDVVVVVDDGFLVDDFASTTTTTTSHKKSASPNDSFPSSFAPNQRVRNSYSIRCAQRCFLCGHFYPLSFSHCFLLPLFFVVLFFVVSCSSV